MNKFIKILSIIGVSAILWGCATSSNLSPGAYNGDTFLYNVDTSIVQTYNVLDNFLIWENANNTYIKTNLPDVFNSANSIRTNAPIVLTLVNIDRALYVSLKNGTNSIALSQASNSLQNATVSFGNQLTNVSSAAIPPTVAVSVSPVTNTLKQILTNTNLP